MSDYYGSQSLGLGVAKSPNGALVISEKEYGTNRYRQDLQAQDFNSLNRQQNKFGGGSLRPTVAGTGLIPMNQKSRANFTGRPVANQQNQVKIDTNTNRDTEEFYAASYSKAPSIQDFQSSKRPYSPTQIGKTSSQMNSGERWKKIESLVGYPIPKVGTPSTDGQPNQQPGSGDQKSGQQQQEIMIDVQNDYGLVRSSQQPESQEGSAEVLAQMRKDYNREKPILLQPSQQTQPGYLPSAYIPGQQPRRARFAGKPPSPKEQSPEITVNQYQPVRKARFAGQSPPAKNESQSVEPPQKSGLRFIAPGKPGKYQTVSQVHEEPTDNSGYGQSPTPPVSLAAQKINSQTISLQKLSDNKRNYSYLDSGHVQPEPAVAKYEQAPKDTVQEDQKLPRNDFHRSQEAGEDQKYSLNDDVNIRQDGIQATPNRVVQKEILQVQQSQVQAQRPQLQTVSTPIESPQLVQELSQVSQEATYNLPQTTQASKYLQKETPLAQPQVKQTSSTKAVKAANAKPQTTSSSKAVVNKKTASPPKERNASPSNAQNNITLKKLSDIPRRKPINMLKIEAKIDTNLSRGATPSRSNLNNKTGQNLPSQTIETSKSPVRDQGDAGGLSIVGYGLSQSPQPSSQKQDTKSPQQHQRSTVSPAQQKTTRQIAAATRGGPVSQSVNQLPSTKQSGSSLLLRNQQYKAAPAKPSNGDGNRRTASQSKMEVGQQQPVEVAQINQSNEENVNDRQPRYVPSFRKPVQVNRRSLDSSIASSSGQQSQPLRSSLENSPASSLKVFDTPYADGSLHTVGRHTKSTASLASSTGVTDLINQVDRLFDVIEGPPEAEEPGVSSTLNQAPVQPADPQAARKQQEAKQIQLKSASVHKKLLSMKDLDALKVPSAASQNQPSLIEAKPQEATPVGAKQLGGWNDFQKVDLKIDEDGELRVDLKPSQLIQIQNQREPKGDNSTPKLGLANSIQTTERKRRQSSTENDHRLPYNNRAVQPLEEEAPLNPARNAGQQPHWRDSSVDSSLQRNQSVLSRSQLQPLSTQANGVNNRAAVIQQQQQPYQTEPTQGNERSNYKAEPSLVASNQTSDNRTDFYSNIEVSLPTENTRILGQQQPAAQRQARPSQQPATTTSAKNPKSLSATSSKQQRHQRRTSSTMTASSQQKDRGYQRPSLAGQRQSATRQPVPQQSTPQQKPAPQVRQKGTFLRRGQGIQASDARRSSQSSMENLNQSEDSSALQFPSPADPAVLRQQKPQHQPPIARQQQARTAKSVSGLDQNQQEKLGNLERQMQKVSTELHQHTQKVLERSKESAQIQEQAKMIKELTYELKKSEQTLRQTQQQMELKQEQTQKDLKVREAQMRQELQKAVKNMERQRQQQSLQNIIYPVQPQPQTQLSPLSQSVPQRATQQTTRDDHHDTQVTFNKFASNQVDPSGSKPDIATTQKLQDQCDTLVRRLQAKDEEVGLLRRQLNDKNDSTRVQSLANQKAAQIIKQLEDDNKVLVKQVDLLTMEKEQLYKVEKEILQNDDRGKEISQLQRELQMKNVEVKVYQNKLKIMREENATVRMQLLDPAIIKRTGGVRHFIDHESNSAAKENIIVDFSRVELTHDVVLLQEEIKQMFVENSILKERLVSFQDDIVEREKAQKEYIGQLQEQLALKKQIEDSELAPQQEMARMIEKLQFQNHEVTESKQKENKFYRNQIQRMQTELKKQETLLALKNQENDKLDRRIRILTTEQGRYKSVQRVQAKVYQSLNLENQRSQGVGGVGSLELRAQSSSPPYRQTDSRR